jgi:hypothetical protein
MEGTTIDSVGIGCCVFTVTAALPDFVVSWVEIAVMVAVPVAEGVNTPAEVIVPSVAVHVTPEL